MYWLGRKSTPNFMFDLPFFGPFRKSGKGGGGGICLLLSSGWWLPHCTVSLFAAGYKKVVWSHKGRSLKICKHSFEAVDQNWHLLTLGGDASADDCNKNFKFDRIFEDPLWTTGLQNSYPHFR